MFNKKSKVRGAVDIESEKRRKQGLYSLFLMAVGSIATLAIGAFFYLSPWFNEKTTPELNAPVEVVPLPQDEPKNTYQFYKILPEQKLVSVPEGVGVQEDKSETETKVRIDTVVKANADKDKAKPAEKPADEITVVEEDATYDDAPGTTSISVQVAEPEVSYILQVRSYDNASEADIKRGEVIMAGVDARVVKRINDEATIYQVVSTPMMSREEAMTAYNRLQTNGIDSVLVEQRRR